MSLNDTFSNRARFDIRNLNFEDDAPEGVFDYINKISFRDEQRVGINNPTIAIDSGGRFAKHDIIGGTTVRQKIGDEPLEIQITGVCFEETARKIDELRNARNGILHSERFAGDEVRVQFASTSTDPLSDGGAAELETGELLYRYRINAIEVS